MGIDTDVTVITSDEARDAGVEHGKLILDVVDAVMNEAMDPSEARRQLVEAAGAGLLVEVGAVLGIFHLNDRVADAMGTPLDEFAIDYRRKIGQRLGLDSRGF